MNPFSLSETNNPNYLASIVQLKNVRAHSNADRLNCVSIFGNNVIVSKEARDGDICVFIPVGCQISREFISWANGFESQLLNKDTTKKGYFDKHARVCPTKLRGELSEGYIIPILSLIQFLSQEKNISVDLSSCKVGTDFDTLAGSLFVNKYVVKKQNQPGAPGTKNSKKKQIDTLRDLLVPNQFRFHRDTLNGKKFGHLFNPDDLISITKKVHGSSAVFANVLLFNKVPKWKRFIAKLFKINIPDKTHAFVYSSRSVIKNNNPSTGYYGLDIWGQHAAEIQAKLPEGFTIYAEIAGYTGNGEAMIQKGYDYGCDKGKNKLFVYRVTYTDSAGQVLELDWTNLKDFCVLHGFETVPLYYFGKAGDCFKGLPKDDPNWHDKFVENIMQSYTDRQDDMCKTNVVEEGVCVRFEQRTEKPAFKFKGFNFLKKESDDLTKGEIDIESAESEQVTE